MQVPDAADLPVRGGPPSPSRRLFVRLLAAAAAAAVVPLYPGRMHARLLFGLSLPTDHPDPRPGIDGSRVLKAEQLPKASDLIELFDAVREIPHIADGILCYCGCAGAGSYRSLLICYEEPGMAQYCDICQGQGRLAHSRWKEGQTLDQIRRATDARYGDDAAAQRARSKRRARARSRLRFTCTSRRTHERESISSSPGGLLVGR